MGSLYYRIMQNEGGIIWDDKDIGIEWPVPEGMELIFSEKDTKWPGIKSLNR